MSAVFSYRSTEDVVVLTDGAVYDNKGVVHFIERKVDFSTKVPVAVATRGDRDVGDLLTGKIIAAVEQWGFDEGLQSIERILPQWRDALASLDDRFTEILVAGISEANGPQHYVCVTGPSPEYPAFHWSDPGKQFCGFNGGGDKPSIITLESMGLRMPLPGEKMLDYFATSGVGMFEYLRRIKLQSNGRFCVGGHVDMTVVSSGGVWVERVHRWNDKIGELIDPSKDRPAAKVVPIAAGMNRQQRRVAERDARKVRAA
jgi:hypothetical protein